MMLVSIVSNSLRCCLMTLFFDVEFIFSTRLKLMINLEVDPMSTNFHCKYLTNRLAYNKFYKRNIKSKPWKMFLTF
jgi:hypothetical protein